MHIFDEASSTYGWNEYCLMLYHNMGKSTLITTKNVHFAEISATMPYKSYEETCHSRAFNL